MTWYGGPGEGWITDRGVLVAVVWSAANVAPLLAPVVDALTPAVGGLAAVVAGLATTVVGSNFQVGATVTIGGLPAIAVFVDASHLAVVTPLLGLGVKDVVVTNPDGQGSGASGVGKFTVTL